MSEAVDRPGAASATAARKRLTLVACILGSIIAFVDMTVVTVALPAIQRDLGGGLTAQQWIADAYLLTLGSLILVGGSLGDIFGEARVFRLGVAWVGVASVLSAVAPTVKMPIAFPGMQGVAGEVGRRGGSLSAGSPRADLLDVLRHRARGCDRDLDRLERHLDGGWPVAR